MQRVVNVECRENVGAGDGGVVEKITLGPGFGPAHKPLKKARVPSGAECPADRGLRVSLVRRDETADFVPARRFQRRRQRVKRRREARREMVCMNAEKGFYERYLP